ncbi:MAG: extracellular solute-binding protein [Solirubrobacteraceae bacterium]
MTRRGLWRIAALALTLFLAGCASATGPGRRLSIVLYNGQHLQLTDELVAAFEKRTGISVQMRTNDSIVLADQLLQEGSSSPADVYLSENSPELEDLDQHGLFARLPRSTLDQVPRADEPPSGDWAPIALRISGLAYDPALISKSSLPRSILEFTAPGWKGKVAIAPTDSDFPPLVGAMIATYGTKVAASWLAGLKHNAQIFATDEAVVAAVNRGAVATGVINQYYWYRLRLELGSGAIHSSVYYFPDHNVGSIENISGVAVLASSTHRQAADAFANFLVGALGQHVLAGSDDFEYPARSDVRPNPALPPESALSPARLGAVELGNDRAAAKLIQQAGLA